jgi:UDP-N-acetylmuramoyl-tripeptide--D-alanyl-D-alanine ligase
MRLMAADVAKATNGVLVGQNAHLSGVSFDSRSIRPGQLFVPIIAERDGHGFIADALKAGAGAYLTCREPQGRTAVVVNDTLQALLQLGSWGRTKLDAQVAGRVVGVTGSVGKTSTKDFIAAAVGNQLRVCASDKSFNNDQGLPITILNASDDVQALVLEMGMRGFGEISRLCAIARPHIGVVTAVAEAHTERVGGIEGVARAKAELVQALDASGTAILNADDERVVAMRESTKASVLTYGTSAAADLRIQSCVLDELARPTTTATTPWGTVSFSLGVPGAHMAMNALAAVAVAGVMGLDVQLAAASLREAKLSPMRMNVIRNNSGAVVVDDAYNANPSSMSAALQSLQSMNAKRRVAFVGLMAELANPEHEHREIAALAQRLGIELVAVNTDAYGVPGIDIAQAAEIGRGLGEGDAVLVKGSRIAQLERLVEQLTS